MNEFFDAAFEYTVGNEGGYTNDPDDDGGPTNWGITIHDLSKFLGRAATAAEVKGMSSATAKEIYMNDYWLALNLPGVKSKGVAMAMFDQGVVRGVSAIALAVQDMVKVKPDAHIGPVTLAAINSHDPKVLVTTIERQAESSFRAIASAHPHDQKFLNGWLNRARRLMSLEQYA